MHRSLFLCSKKRQKKTMMVAKKNAKNKKGGEEGSLPSNSHFCHHLEAPLVGGTLEAPSLWSSYWVCAPRLEALAMEVSAKRGHGWREVQQDEGGRWVGRKKGGSWVGIGRSFPKKNLGSGVGQKNNDKKSVPRKKKKKNWPSKLTPGGQFHPIHEISERDFWMVHWWVLGHSSRAVLGVFTHINTTRQINFQQKRIITKWKW